MPFSPNISIRGATTGNRKLIRTAVKSLSKILMSTRLGKTIDIFVEFVPDLLRKEKLWAEIEPMDEWFYRTPRTFTIRLDQRLNNSPIRLLLVLCHEMVHVKQMARGEWKDCHHGVRFHGKVYGDDVAYNDQPWENEALEMEKPLLVQLLQQGIVNSIWRTSNETNPQQDGDGPRDRV